MHIVPSLPVCMYAIVVKKFVFVTAQSTHHGLVDCIFIRVEVHSSSIISTVAPSGGCLASLLWPPDSTYHVQHQSRLTR